MKPIIFLDIDGVLALKNSPLSDKHEGVIFKDEAVEQLHMLLGSFDADIVIISDRRMFKPLKELQNLFSHYSLDKYIADKLPDEMNYMDRESAVTMYIYKNKIEKYIIIDDMPYFKEKFKDRLISVNPKIGLKISESDYRRCIKYL